jgi:hypothetical protein
MEKLPPLNALVCASYTPLLGSSATGLKVARLRPLTIEPVKLVVPTFGYLPGGDSMMTSALDRRTDRGDFVVVYVQPRVWFDRVGV